MSPPIKQTVTVRQGGVVEVHSPDLHEGDRAEVTIVVVPTEITGSTRAANGGWRKYAGTVKGGNPEAGSSSQIDADLAVEHQNERTPES